MRTTTIRSIILGLTCLLLSTYSAKATLWDFQLSFSAEDSSGAGGNAAATFIGTEFWTAEWNSNLIHRFTPTGTYINGFVVPGYTGTRSMSWTGNQLMASNNTDSIVFIDTMTKTIVNSINVGATVRWVAWDPLADGGAGGFWCGSWTTDWWLFDLSGNGLDTITAAEHGFSAVYGVAVDTFTTGGPYLWVSWHDGNQSQSELDRFEIATNTRANENFDVEAALGYTAGSTLNGGIFITNALVPGKFTIGGCVQGAPEIVYAYELNDIIPPSHDASVFLAELVDGYTEIPLSHATNVPISGEIENTGAQMLDSIRITLNVSDGISTVHTESQMLYNVNPGATNRVTFTGFTPGDTIDYTGMISTLTFGTQIDSVPGNNDLSFDFKVSDKVYSRHDEASFRTAAYTLATNNWGLILARYDLLEDDSLGSINIILNGPIAGDTTYGVIYSEVAGQPSLQIARTPDYILNAGQSFYRLRFNDTLMLSAGTYFFGVYEGHNTGIRLAHSDDNYREDVNFFNVGGGAWTASGIQTARAISPNFNWDELDCTGFSASVSGAPGPVIDQGQTLIMSVNSTLQDIATYSWAVDGNPIAGATGSSYTTVGGAAGVSTYSVTVTATKGCVTTATFLVNTQDTTTVTGIAPVEISSINLYPNPVSNTMIIDLGEVQEEVQALRMIDMQGRVMKEINHNGETRIEVDVEGYPTGNYLLEIAGEGWSHQKKLMKL